MNHKIPGEHIYEEKKHVLNKFWAFANHSWRILNWSQCTRRAKTLFYFYINFFFSIYAKFFMILEA